MNVIALKVETLTVHDANGQPYRLADAIFDVDGVKRLVVELAALKTNCAEISSKLVVAERENAALRAALKSQVEWWEQLPCGVDYEADQENASPVDTVAHIAGLAVKEARAAEAKP